MQFTYREFPIQVAFDPEAFALRDQHPAVRRIPIPPPTYMLHLSADDLAGCYRALGQLLLIRDLYDIAYVVGGDEAPDGRWLHVAYRLHDDQDRHQVGSAIASLVHLHATTSPEHEWDNRQAVIV